MKAKEFRILTSITVVGVLVVILLMTAFYIGRNEISLDTESLNPAGSVTDAQEDIPILPSEEVVQADVIVFIAPWDSRSIAVQAEIEKSSVSSEIQIEYVDAYSQQTVASQWGITTVPAVVIFSEDDEPKLIENLHPSKVVDLLLAISSN